MKNDEQIEVLTSPAGAEKPKRSGGFLVLLAGFVRAITSHEISVQKDH